MIAFVPNFFDEIIYLKCEESCVRNVALKLRSKSVTRQILQISITLPVYLLSHGVIALAGGCFSTLSHSMPFCGIIDINESIDYSVRSPRISIRIVHAKNAQTE